MAHQQNTGLPVKAVKTKLLQRAVKFVVCEKTPANEVMLLEICCTFVIYIFGKNN